MAASSTASIAKMMINPNAASNNNPNNRSSHKRTSTHSHRPLNGNSISHLLLNQEPVTPMTPTAIYVGFSPQIGSIGLQCTGPYLHFYAYEAPEESSRLSQVTWPAIRKLAVHRIGWTAAKFLISFHAGRLPERLVGLMVARGTRGDAGSPPHPPHRLEAVLNDGRQLLADLLARGLLQKQNSLFNVHYVPTYAHLPMLTGGGDGDSGRGGTLNSSPETEESLMASTPEQQPQQQAHPLPQPVYHCVPQFLYPHPNVSGPLWMIPGPPQSPVAPPWMGHLSRSLNSSNCPSPTGFLDAHHHPQQQLQQQSPFVGCEEAVASSMTPPLPPVMSSSFSRRTLSPPFSASGHKVCSTSPSGSTTGGHSHLQTWSPEGVGHFLATNPQLMPSPEHFMGPPGHPARRRRRLFD